MKKLLLFCLLSFLILANTDIYANSKAHYENQFKNLKTLPITEDCITRYHTPCPEGSSGEGWYGYVIKNCDTGEVVGGGWYDYGCVNDEEVDPEP